MRPFGDLSGTPLKFFFSEKYSCTVSDFRLDFYDTQDFKKKELNQINNYIINCLGEETIMPNFKNNFIKLNKNNIKQFLLQLNQFSPLYYTEFEKLYFELCRFQESELYQQPLLYIFLCDIQDDINIIEDLLNNKNFPKLISNDVYEQNTCELIILLNDKSNNMTHNNNYILESNFKNKYYGKYVISIDINSGYLNEFKNNISDDIWSKYIHKIEEYSDGFDHIKRGRYITNNEVDDFKKKFRDFMKDIFCSTINNLINQIDKNLSKSGGINSFFNKLKGKQEKQELIQGFNIPRLNVNDKQRYLLSVLLFHIRDYNDSYENLKKLKDTIKGKYKDYDNAIKQFLLICRYMKKEDKSKIDTLSAFLSYYDNKQFILAFRSILLHLKMAEQLRTNNIIDNIYKYNYHLSRPIVKYLNALVYEKIGYYNFFSDHPKIRKFALNVLCFSTQQYTLEKDDDIKYNYLLQNLGYICDLFKIDYDYSQYDNDMEVNTFALIKKYIFNYICLACEATNNFQFGIPIFINYLRLILLEQKDNILNSKKNKLFDFSDNDETEIDTYFQKFNSLFIKGKIQYLDNFPLPIIEDESLIFNLEQDQKIIKENNKLIIDFVKSFEKYLELSIEQKYSVLSEDDISCLRYVDEQCSRTFASNYFMKTLNNVRVGEKIIIKFNVVNPLSINMQINNMTLIITKKNLDNNTPTNIEYECDSCDVELPKNTMHEVKMTIVFKSPGMFEISGLTMTLFKNINIRYFFNKRTMNNLYINNRFNNRVNNYTKHIKHNFRFNVIEAIKSISINVNRGSSKIYLFQNQVEYLPVEIRNNNNDVEIRKYTIFLGTDNSVILYPKYLHKNYLYPSNTILIPIIGNNIGECKLKIVIKFEEKTKLPVLDIYRNVLIVKVNKGINLNIEDNIYEYNKLVNRRLIELNMDIIQKVNIQSISFSKSKSIIINKKKFMIENINEDNNENMMSDNKTSEIQDKNINQKIILKLLKNENNEEYDNEQLLDEIIGHKRKEDQNNYEHIKEFLKEKFCNENNLILKYKINLMDNNGMNTLFCIYKHEIKIKETTSMKSFYVDNLYLKNLLQKVFNINYEVEDFEEDQKYITINIKLLNDNENFERIGKIIEYIEINVNCNDNNFEWIGLCSTKFKNLLKINNDDSMKTFNCIIDGKSCSLNDKKNEINLNHFIFAVKIKNSDLIYQYTDFPYSIYYNRQFNLM